MYMSYKSLREECYYKTGRKGVVFECIDMIKPNLFDNNRNISNDIFNSGSKFRFTIIDSRKTEGTGKAIYYNLDSNEVLLLTHILSDGVATSFKKRAGAFNDLSGVEQNHVRELVSTFDSINFRRFDAAMDYTKKSEATVITLQKNIHIGNNQLLVRKFMISYEEAMNSSSKWKLTIEVGEAKRDDKGNGLNIVKYGTYKTTDKVQLMLQANEITTPINEASKRVVLSQSVFYAQMKKAEADFTRRKIENADYEGDKIDEWNPQGKPIVYKARVDDSPKEELEVEQTKKAESKKEVYSCTDCGLKIDKNINDYSIKFHKRPLCFACQKAEKSKKEA